MEWTEVLCKGGHTIVGYYIDNSQAEEEPDPALKKVRKKSNRKLKKRKAKM